MKPTVGLIGLGLMGKPMGRNLLKAGFPLIVWNRTSSRADDLVKEGARLASNPREVASQVDVLITIVSDPRHSKKCCMERMARSTGCVAAAFTLIPAQFLPTWLAALPMHAVSEESIFSMRLSQGGPGEQRRANLYSWLEGKMKSSNT